MNKKYSYLTSEYESVFAQMYEFLVEKTHDSNFLLKNIMVGDFVISFVRHNYFMYYNVLFIHCSQNTVVHGQVYIFV